MARLQFISKVIFGIEREWMEEKKKQHFQRSDKEGRGTFGLVKVLDRNSRECFVYSKKTRRKRAHLICVHCRKRVHLTIGKHKYHQT